MGTDQSHEESSKNGVYADNIGEKCRGQNHQECERNHALGRSPLESAILPENPDECWTDGVDEEEDPGNGNQKYVERRYSVSSIDESDCKSEEHPADNVVAYTRREHNSTDIGPEQLELGQDTGEYRKGL